MENAVKTTEKQRYVFIEVLRIAACFLVIVNHTNSDIFMYKHPWPSEIWFASLAYFFISKMAVPIFVMISGFTMLDKQDDYKKSMQRVLRSVAVLLLFSLIHYLQQWQNGARAEIGIKNYLVSVYQTPLSLAYWYMYMYIGLLIMMPFLQKLVAGLNKKDFQIFIGISLFVNGIMPIVERIWPMFTYSRLFDFAVFDSYIGLLMIGCYMKRYVTPSKKGLILAIVGFFGALYFNLVMTYHEYWVNGGANYFFYENRTLFPIILQGICFFYFIMYFSWKGRIAGILKVVGGCTFGIFLLSDLFIEKYRYVYEALYARGMHPILAVILFEILVFMIGFVITFIMKQIPVLKKLL